MFSCHLHENDNLSQLVHNFRNEIRKSDLLLYFATSQNAYLKLSSFKTNSQKGFLSFIFDHRELFQACPYVRTLNIIEYKKDRVITLVRFLWTMTFVLFT